MKCECGCTEFILLNGFVCKECGKPAPLSVEAERKTFKPKYFRFGKLGTAVETPHFRDRLHGRHQKFKWEELKTIYRQILSMDLEHHIIHAVEYKEYYVYFKIDYHYLRKRRELSLISITPNNILESENDKEVTLVELKLGEEKK
jgi:hypothetical protein